MSIKFKNIAIYIDCDNISPEIWNCKIKKNIDIIGNIIIKKSYGDFTRPELSKWNKISINEGFRVIHCPNIPRKNSTDICLITDLICDYHEKKHIDTFIIISSDSDYSYPIQKLKENNKNIIIVGHSHTPDKLKKSCTKFINIDNIKKLDSISKINKLNYKANNDKFKNILLSIFFKKTIISKPEFMKLIVKCKNKINKHEWYYFDTYLKNNFKEFFRIKKIKNAVIIIYIGNITTILKKMFKIKNNYYLSYIKDTLKEKINFNQSNYGYKKMSIFLNDIYPDLYLDNNTNIVEYK